MRDRWEADLDDQRDRGEAAYWAAYCRACNHSPCTCGERLAGMAESARQHPSNTRRTP